MLGYFIGGEFAYSDIKGDFSGDQTRLAASAGGYAVHALNETLFAHGFVTLGSGRNNLKIADDVITLDSDYSTQTASLGAALTGVYEFSDFELRPEVAFNYGKTWIGDVGFTGTAYNITDSSLNLNAGNVSVASLTLRPEIVFALDDKDLANSNSHLSLAPRFICERTMSSVVSEQCGGGLEVGLLHNSQDGLSAADIRLVVDRVGNSTRTTVGFKFEAKF
jgi:hypothetical protein